MSTLGEAVYSVIGGAVICGILISLAPKGQCEGLIKFLCGLFLTVSLLQPLTNLDFNNLFSNPTITEWEEGEAVAAMGEDFSRQLLAQRIKQDAEEYIWDKATALGASLTAEITLSQEDIPVPVAVTISGAIEEPTKKRLEQIITDDLGISKENQLWTELNSAKK